MIDYLREASDIVRNMPRPKPNLEAEVWEVCLDCLADVFLEPEHLLPLVHREILAVRTQTQKRLDQYPYLQENLNTLDKKLKRVSDCITFIADIRRVQRGEG